MNSPSQKGHELNHQVNKALFFGGWRVGWHWGVMFHNFTHSDLQQKYQSDLLFKINLSISTRVVMKFLRETDASQTSPSSQSSPKSFPPPPIYYTCLKTNISPGPVFRVISSFFWRVPGYPSSHNHEMKNGSPPPSSIYLSKTAIFHFHDYIWEKVNGVSWFPNRW